ncbi:MAG: AMP-binding protein, partial [Lachnospiraceae bacterium]|nr:AMP-binding protein [Lachnospiraceae bacterium]
MIITELLEKNAKIYPNDVSLVEINPEQQPDRAVTWREYNLIEGTPGEKYRREMTWKEFDVKANRFANLLMTRGIKKGDKVAILMM